MDKFCGFIELYLFKSFTISQNLLESIPDKKRRKALKAQLNDLKNRQGEHAFEKKVWKPFEKQFVKDFADMGPHWQILILKEEKDKHEENKRRPKTGLSINYIVARLWSEQIIMDNEANCLKISYNILQPPKHDSSTKSLLSSHLKILTDG